MLSVACGMARPIARLTCIKTRRTSAGFAFRYSSMVVAFAMAPPARSSIGSARPAAQGSGPQIRPVGLCARWITASSMGRMPRRRRREGRLRMKAYGAEFFGTFWLVLGGCGSAVLAAAFPSVGIGLHGVSLAFGLTVLTMAYAIGHISGGHFNPAVSIGLWTGGRFPTALLLPYIVAQVVGGVLGAGVLYLIASGKADFSLAAGFASNGYGAHSPGGYSLAAGLICEVVMTFMFLLVILGTTHKRAPTGFAGLGIGLALTLIH